jgi:uncharacterized protein YjiS (DUF1127 family)
MWKEDIRVLSAVEQSNSVGRSGYTWEAIDQEIQHARSLRGEALAKIIGNVTASVTKSVTRWFERRNAYRELSGMDAYLLRDIGVSRHEVEALAYSGKTDMSFVLVPFAALGKLFGVVAKAVVSWNERRHVYWELSTMDDRMLADIGIARAEIKAIAYYGKVRKPYVHKPVNVDMLRSTEVTGVASNQDIAHQAA